MTPEDKIGLTEELSMVNISKDACECIINYIESLENRIEKLEDAPELQSFENNNDDAFRRHPERA